MTLEYKRSVNTVTYPETVDTTMKRYNQFYKTIIEKYFPDNTKVGCEKSRLVIIVTHGVQAHNPFLHLFEADKDCVFLDYGAVTIAEKTSRSMASMLLNKD